MRKRKKIFLGVTNTANVAMNYADDLRMAGYETYSLDVEGGVVASTERVADMDVRATIPAAAGNKWGAYYQWRIREGWKRAVQECDYFLFCWQSFRWDWRDLAELKALGKKIGVIFATSEVQLDSVVAQMARNFRLPMAVPDSILQAADEPLHEFRRKLHLLRMVEKYADFIFGGLLPCALGLRPNIICYNLSGLWRNISYQPPKREVPVVLHIATKRQIKGTDIWLKVVEELRAEGLRFEFRLMELAPHKDVLRAMEDADIFAYAIGRGGSAVYEAMSAGTPVLTSMAQKDRSTWNDFDLPQLIRGIGGTDLASVYGDIDREVHEMPVIDVNAGNVKEQLRRLIVDLPLRQRLAQAGRDWIEKYCINKSRERIDALIALLEGECSDASLEQYRFYREFYDPGTSPAKVALLNRYNRLVCDCEWYRRHIPSGTRGQLEF